MANVYPFQIRSRLMKIFEKAAAAVAVTPLKSGTFGFPKSGRAILWTKTSGATGSPVWTTQLYSVRPELDTQQDAAAPADKVTYGTTITNTGNELKRTELGTAALGLLSQIGYMEVAGTGSGGATFEAWLEILD